MLTCQGFGRPKFVILRTRLDVWKEVRENLDLLELFDVRNREFVLSWVRLDLWTKVRPNFDS